MSGSGSFTPHSARTGREPLDSSGSCHSIALRHDADLPVSKQTMLVPRHLAQPVCGPSLADSVSLVFATCPANQPPIQSLEGSPKRCWIVPAAVVDPSSDLRVEHPGQIVQFQMTHPVDEPFPYLSIDGAFRLHADGRKEAGEHFAPTAFSLAGSKAVAQEVELDVFVGLSSAAVPAVHDACLLPRFRANAVGCRSNWHPKLGNCVDATDTIGQIKYIKRDIGPRRLR